jgi:pimeloyl-ACP methyl ester carboxylesterase
MGAVVDQEIIVADGRRLLVRDHGGGSDVAVLVLDGTPGSRLVFEDDVASADRHGIRLISYDRPGFGGSDPRPARSVGDCVDDVRAIVASLGVTRCGVWGVSGGGPHALACAALLPDLVGAVAVLASPAPWGAEGLDYFDGMGELNVADTRLMLADPAAAREKFDQDRGEMLAADLPALIAMLQSLLAPVDLAVLTERLGAFALESMRTALAPGAEGWWEDSWALMQPWGFALDAIRTPVLYLHGRHDRFVPFPQGEWLASRIPGVESVLSDHDGHLSLVVNHLDGVHAWLRGQLTR